MRVEFALASLLPSITGAKLRTVSGTSSGRQLDRNAVSRGLIAQHLLNSPIWKEQLSSVVNGLQPTKEDSDADQPDVGILAPRNLDEFQSLFNGFNSTDGSDFSMCDLLAGEDGTTCDCDNFMLFMGSISCTGTQKCFDEDEKVCGKTTFTLDTEMFGNFTMDYCIDLTEPSEHSYCMQYAVSAENVFGSILGGDESTGSCSLTIDGKTCNACNVQAECNQMKDGYAIAGLGTNVPVGALSNSLASICLTS